jgi:NAD(P)-dependent dehydrogenase (short-subunit alcohol dehydrogenase family)
MNDIADRPAIPRLNFSLEGRVAMVTGANKGLGHDLTLALAGAGAHVIAAARNPDQLSDVLAAIDADGGEATAVRLDLTDLASIDAAVAAGVERFGKLDILVNNAGLGFNHDAIDVTEADWDDMMDVNLKGLFFMAQAAARRMLPQGYGRIINMASQAGLVGIPRHVVYTASKAAVIGLTKVMALEWAPQGVTVNALAPTWVYTPGTAERLDEPAFLASVLDRIPAGRVGSTMDIAAATIYLASEHAGMVNGSVLVVDGGWTAQ